MSPKKSDKQDLSYEGAMEKALTLLEYRSRTCDQMRKQLLERGFDEEITDAVILRLTELRLLDDERYAARYVEARTRKGYGVRRSRYELKQRGIPEEILEEASQNVSEEEELESALPVARKIWQRSASQERNRRRSKLYAGLVQRGFGYETIERAMRIVEGEEEEE